MLIGEERGPLCSRKKINNGNLLKKTNGFNQQNQDDADSCKNSDQRAKRQYFLNNFFFCLHETNKERIYPLKNKFIGARAGKKLLLRF